MICRLSTLGYCKQISPSSTDSTQGDIADPNNYTYETVNAYCEDSLRRLNRKSIDLFQIHCPATEILREGSVFKVLDQLKALSIDLEL